MNGHGMQEVEDIQEADPPEGCEGVAYKGSRAYTGGDVRWAKEQWHVSALFSSPGEIHLRMVMENLLDSKWPYIICS